MTDLAPWYFGVRGPDGQEHAVLSDGRHHIRIDVDEGSLAQDSPCHFHYMVDGIDRAAHSILPLRRWLHLCRHRRFSTALFPPDPIIMRQILLLRTNDALALGASYRDIAIGFFGVDRTRRDWNGRSDSLRSQIRRLVKDARSMAQGGYRSLLHRRKPS
jgi:hypothetical protein